MTHIVADHLVDSTATTGTSVFFLDAPSLTSYRNIGDVCANGDTIWYLASHRLLGQSEVGKGTYGSGTGVLTRTTILASSNAGSAVNFSAGTKDIVAAVPASVVSGLVVEYRAESYGVAVANTGTANHSAMNALIALANISGGRIVMPHGKLYFSGAWDAITGNGVIVQGQGGFTSGTELCFANATGDSIVLSTSGHQGIVDCYITSSVAKTAGYAIKLASGCYRPPLRNVLIDYHYNGIYVSNASEPIIDCLTLRNLTGTSGIQVGDGVFDAVYGVYFARPIADNPYSVSDNGTRKSWKSLKKPTISDVKR